MLQGHNFGKREQAGERKKSQRVTIKWWGLCHDCSSVGRSKAMNQNQQ